MYIIYNIKYKIYNSGTGNPFERPWITGYLLQDCNHHYICWKDLEAAFKQHKYHIVEPFVVPSNYFLFLFNYFLLLFNYYLINFY